MQGENVMETDFIWLIHPLNDEQRMEWITENGITLEQTIEEGPKVVDVVKVGTELTGHIICTPLLPTDLIKRKNVVHQLELIKELLKDFEGTPPVGLGGWWASATRKGSMAKEILKGHTIIDGYKGTVKRLLQQVSEHAPSRVPMEHTKVAIIGGGEVGKRLYNEFGDDYITTIFEKYKVKELIAQGYEVHHIDELKGMIDTFNIGVCCTSTTEDIIKVENIPKGFVFVDDSYPHTIPAYAGRIEGGVYKDDSITSDFLIKDGNIFGCLMELIEVARKER